VKLLLFFIFVVTADVYIYILKALKGSAIAGNLIVPIQIFIALVEVGLAA